MTLRITDTWRGRCRGTPEQAIATFARWGSFPIEDVTDATREIYRLCHLIGLDASLLVSHAALETGDEDEGKAFLDENWATEDEYRAAANRYNIAGIGITDDEDHGYGFPDGLTAARAFVVHHARYELPPDDPAWEHLEPYVHLDPRFDAVPAANGGTVRTVADMTGKWWTNPQGHTSLVERGTSIFPGIADQQPNQQEEPPVTDTPRDRPIVIAIGMGHRNTGRGGASGEYDWTPSAARALQRRARARGMIAELIQEFDSDNDPSYSQTDRMTAATRGAKAIAAKHGRLDVIVFQHYNGGPAAGAHFLFPDGWVSPVTAAENPGDIRLARLMATGVKQTGTVSLLAWPDRGPGVMSERESGAVNNVRGARLGEFLGTDSFRTAYRIIAEAGSIDVARERAFIRDPRWVEFTYCEALLNAIEAELGEVDTPAPVDPTPQPDPTYATPVRIPEVDAFLKRPAEACPAMIRTKDHGVMWLIDREVGVTKTTGRNAQPDEKAKERTGPDLAEGDIFYAWYGGISKSGRPFTYTLWASYVWLDDTDQGLAA
jgi:hypothetical protein